MPIGTGGKVLLVTSGAVITFLGARAVWAASRPRAGVGDCAPYKWDPDAVRATIDSVIDQGGMTVEDVASVVATEHYGHHPGGGVAQFPPTNGLPGAECIWALVYDLTQRVWAESPPDIDYNELVSQFESGNNQPEMGTIFNRQQGDSMVTIARRALQNAGISQMDGANRIALMRLIECGPYNDAVYNVKLSENSFKSRLRQDQPYGISGYPQHHDNLLRMKQGLPVRRAALRNSMDKHEAIPGGARHADMWIPLLKPGTEVVGPNSVATWQDGSSAINPPTEILALGFENVASGEYGCSPWTTTVESL